MSWELAFVRVFNGNPDANGVFKGTAFFIRPQQLLTARHVLESCPNGVFLRVPDGGVLAIESQWVEAFERDVATIHLPRAFPITPLLLARNPPNLRDAVTLCGFYDEQQSLHERQTHISGYVNVQHTWNIADGVKAGMSGGAVIREGELVGLIQARDEESKNITYCIPIDVIRACLGELPDQTQVTPQDFSETDRVTQVFVGRGDELAQLRAALLGTAQTPVAITAVHGMAGVGKSWLADHFYVTHESQFAGGYQRIVLTPDNPMSADLLLADLAERLQIAVPKQQLATQVAWRLNHPRTLVHIENVDSDAAATVATTLCSFLPRCSIVLSGRLDHFGKARRWQQVCLKPFHTADALAQLHKELHWFWLQANEIPDQAAAERLVNVLGGLPLAIHLAAGYLAAGRSVEAFLYELHATGFALPPEDTTDGSYNRDQTRAVLHSTFQLSLNLLATQAALHQLEDAPHLLACLGFAPSGGFGLSIAATLMALDEMKAESLLSLTRKLSLVELIQTTPSRWQVHPLLADYLRHYCPEQAVSERLHAWFLQRLPEPLAENGQAPDYRPWHELNTEHVALSEWLANVPTAWQVATERAGSQYAMRNGPFVHWMSFCQSALRNPILTIEQRSGILFTLAYVAHSSGDLDKALSTAQEKVDLDKTQNNEREATLAKGKIADILEARGQLDDALRIRTEDQLPVYERLGDVRLLAITKGQIADILQARGQLDDALRILTDDLIPVFERLGEVRSIAITKGKIADILQARGQLDDALRIRQQEELPVYERIGEVREIAITKGQIGNILFLQENQTEAINIYNRDVLPIYEYLGDKRMLLVGKSNLAIMYLQRAEEKDFSQANELLCWALHAAQQMQIPQAEQIAAILQHFGMKCAS